VQFFDQSGATAIEYGLIAAGISLAAQRQIRFHQHVTEIAASNPLGKSSAFTPRDRFARPRLLTARREGIGAMRPRPFWRNADSHIRWPRPVR
jgi:hypothetical protein